MKDTSQLRIKETVVLKKFDGDSERDEDLLEQITLEDGVVIDHWVKEEGDGPQAVQ